MSTICPCCEGKGTIEPGHPVRLTPIQGKIYNLVRAARFGIDVSRLAAAVYADRIDGGPHGANWSINTQIYKMNRRLEPVGERIRSEGLVYKLFRNSALRDPSCPTATITS
jgi:hypothetical protein